MTLRVRFVLACTLLAQVLLKSPSLEASVLLPLSTAQLVARAERIVVGTVVGQESHWVDGGSAIVTDVRIRVTRAVLGAQEGEIITVRRLGGTVGEIGMRVFGEASFRDGEEVLLFAERRGGAYYSVGMTQGTLHITQQGGRRMAQMALGGAEIVGRSGVAPVVRPLEEVLDEVRRALAARRPEPAQGRSEQTR
ncbi:MAG: hypothetical protein RMK29_09625 [Myxococcales bacterium]|nr:hypothetical protein [Myxococcota bacterium]MDW8281960.1 hypothetical protein [Myxococcales bacterium]